MPSPVTDETTTSVHTANSESPTSPINQYDLGDYPSEQTVWDIEAALILFNMRNSTSLTVADWKAANYLIHLAGGAEKQATEIPGAVVEADKPVEVTATPSVVQPRKPKLVSRHSKYFARGRIFGLYTADDNRD